MSGLVIAASAASAASAAASAPAAASAAASAAAASPGFFAASLAFIASMAVSWPALIVLFILGVLFEHNAARGWAVFTALVTAATTYFFFTVPLLTILIFAGVYLLFGIGWSVWRYKRHVDKVVSEHKNSSPDVRTRVARSLHPKEMLSTITAWIIVWPFSFVGSISGDLINAIEAIVTKVFRGVYHRIYNSAIAALRLDDAN